MFYSQGHSPHEPLPSTSHSHLQATPTQELLPLIVPSPPQATPTQELLPPMGHTHPQATPTYKPLPPTSHSHSGATPTHGPHPPTSHLCNRPTTTTTAVAPKLHSRWWPNKQQCQMYCFKVKYLLFYSQRNFQYSIPYSICARGILTASCTL